MVDDDGAANRHALSIHARSSRGLLAMADPPSASADQEAAGDQESWRLGFLAQVHLLEKTTTDFEASEPFQLPIRAIHLAYAT